MPPGLHVDSKNSLITGQVPDVNAIYSFTVRATNVKDKYADVVFRMEIIGKYLQEQTQQDHLYLVRKKDIYYLNKNLSRNIAWHKETNSHSHWYDTL